MDFSDRAITLARSLSAELGIDARFVLSNVYDLPGSLDDRFDVVFTSYGALYWLPDLPAWAGVVSHFLKPEHLLRGRRPPTANVFDEESGDIRLKWPYFTAACR